MLAFFTASWYTIKRVFSLLEGNTLFYFWKSGRENEILGTAQFFEEGTKTFEQDVGVRTQGNFTRLYPKKSIQLFSRNVYSGSSVFDQKFFGKYDSHAVYVSAFPEKAYCMNLMENRNVGLQGFKKYALFINGEYWYTAVLMEKYDETYFAQHYGVGSENTETDTKSEAVENSNEMWLWIISAVLIFITVLIVIITVVFKQRLKK